MYEFSNFTIDCRATEPIAQLSLTVSIEDSLGIKHVFPCINRCQVENLRFCSPGPHGDFENLGLSGQCLTLYSLITPLKYHVFENIMENGAFAPCSIFHNIFKSIPNTTLIFLDFFQCCLKIEMIS